MGKFYIRAGDTVWVESYSDAAPAKSANGTILYVDWANRAVHVEFSHPSGKELIYYDFDELRDTYDNKYKCFMLFDVVE